METIGRIDRFLTRWHLSTPHLHSRRHARAQRRMDCVREGSRATRILSLQLPPDVGRARVLAEPSSTESPHRVRPSEISAVLHTPAVCLIIQTCETLSHSHPGPDGHPAPHPGRSGGDHAVPGRRGHGYRGASCCGRTPRHALGPCGITPSHRQRRDRRFVLGKTPDNLPVLCKRRLHGVHRRRGPVPRAT